MDFKIKSYTETKLQLTKTRTQKLKYYGLHDDNAFTAFVAAQPDISSTTYLYASGLAEGGGKAEKRSACI